jgi:hypothetical protein
MRRDSEREGGGGMDFVAVVDQGLALLHPRGRQDGVHRAGNVLAAHGGCPSGGACYT